jgi:glycosyltransferase involved in cell wall biosynthesis
MALDPPSVRPRSARVDMSRHYGVDGLAIRGGRCFGWGWYLDEASAVERCVLVVPSRNGGEQRVPCIFSGMREDLRIAFPSVRHAAAAGFMIHGMLVEEAMSGAPAYLDVLLRDGRRDRCEVPASVFSVAPTQRPRMFARARAAVAAFRRKAANIGVWPAFVHAVRKLTIGTHRSSLARILARLSSLRDGATVLLFDHDMGGGANRYREDAIAALLRDGLRVVLIVPRMPSLDYRVSIHEPGAPKSQEAYVDSLAEALAAVGRNPGLDIRVNELVSFPDPLAVLEWCAAMRAESATRLGFYLHDYHAACPAWTLIADDGRYCDLPSYDRCRACLPDNLANTLGFSIDVDPERWRACWSRFLAVCDEIVAFSDASARILRRAHPSIDAARIAVRPHRVEHAGLRAVTPSSGPPVVIAVAGHISRPKGADMLLEMAEAIRRDALPARIVVFGTLEGHLDDSGIEVGGRFERSALPSLLEAHAASICFLPSICPETFSFVTDEYMAMRMPVAVFPIGAPAERVAGYADGLVISRVDAATAVREILEFVGRRPAAGTV